MFSVTLQLIKRRSKKNNLHFCEAIIYFVSQSAFV
jgi:hypothetical protein